jgi:hypothetical protein
MTLTIHKQLNQFSDELVELFSFMIQKRLAVGIDRLEGKAFEKMWCEIHGTEWRGSNKGIIDVGLDTIGYSMKSLEFEFPILLKKGGYKSIRTILGRNSPDFHGKHVDRNVTPAHEAGEIVCDIWNQRLMEARSLYKEVRTIVLLKSKDLTQWAMFEYYPNTFDASTWTWAWVTRQNSGKSTTNLEGVKGEKKLTWQPHGSQFTLSQRIPSYCRQFQVGKPPLFSIDEYVREWNRRITMNGV